MFALQQVKTGRRHAGAEALGIVEQAGAQIIALVDHIEGFQRGADNHRGQRIGEEIGSRALAQHVDHGLARRGETAHGAAERLAERAGDDVDLAEHAAMLRRAAAARAHEAMGMAIIDHGQRVIGLRQRHDLVEPSDIAIHREDAIGDDQDVPRAIGPRLFQLDFQVGHVGIGIAIAFRLAQPHAIDDRGVIERVGNDRILGAQQRLEYAAIGVKRRRIENGILTAGEIGDLRFKLFVDVLGAADEAHRGETEPVRVERVFRGLDQLGPIGEAEIVIGAEIDDVMAGTL